jgi:hypothetical protein
MSFLKEIKFVKSIRGKYSKIQDYSFLIVPHSSSSELRSYKLSTKKVILFFIVYSIVGSVFGFLFYTVTGLGNYMLPDSNSPGVLQTKDQMLLNKINLLLIELEGVRSVNEQLKRAVTLGDSTLFKRKPDSLNSNQLPQIGGGSIYKIFKELFIDRGDTIPKIPYFSKPVNGFVSRDFNPDIGHFGIDYVVKSGTPVYSTANGFIVFADFISRDGYTIIISHPGNYLSFYKHCSILVKKERENVLQGELIALSGNSGEITTGPHLHFELWENGLPVNPRGYLINYLRSHN